MPKKRKNKRKCYYCNKVIRSVKPLFVTIGKKKKVTVACHRSCRKRAKRR